MGTGYLPQNAGKHSISINIHTPAGAAAVRSIAARADIFVENFRPGSMAKHGLDYATLSALNPQLLYTSISAFGQNGPHGHRPGFDDVIQATAGFMSINQRGDGPMRTGGPVLDYATGMQAASAVLAAVLLRQQTGKGQHVDIAMQDVTMLLMNRQASIAATQMHTIPAGKDRDGPMLGRFKTADGYVMLAGYLPKHCRGLCKALGLDTFAARSGKQLAEQASELEAAVEQILLTKTSQAWDDIFSTAAVVGGAVRDLVEIHATGQPAARQLFSTTSTPQGDIQVTNNGYRINDEVFRPSSPPPTLGAHTNEILAEYGYSQNEIDTLITEGVIPAD